MMALPCVHPLVMNEMIVLISGAFIETFSIDEQDVIGNFLQTLGSMICLNSSYLSYQQDMIQEEPEDQYELLEKSIDKIKEEIEKLKKDKQ